MIAALFLALAASDDQAPIQWGKQRLDAAALPAELSAPARAAIEAWHPWSSAHAYKLDLGPYIEYGASPRATIYLALAAKAFAFLRGRGYVTPQDVKSIGMDVLRHRVAVTYEAEAEEKTSEIIIQKIFDELPVP